MDDALLVGVFQRVHKLDEDRQSFLILHRPMRDALGQRGAVH
jgi:hypothetical protein